jgi:hypothetical protein
MTTILTLTMNNALDALPDLLEVIRNCNLWIFFSSLKRLIFAISLHIFYKRTVENWIWLRYSVAYTLPTLSCNSVAIVCPCSGGIAIKLKICHVALGFLTIIFSQLFEKLTCDGSVSLSWLLWPLCPTRDCLLSLRYLESVRTLDLVLFLIIFRAFRLISTLSLTVNIRFLTSHWNESG